MGIRPNMFLVVGVNNFQQDIDKIVDTRWCGSDDWQNTPLTVPEANDYDNTPESRKRYWRGVSVNALYAIQQGDGSVPGELWEIVQMTGTLLGCRVSNHLQNYANLTLYALAALDKKYSRFGYTVLPSLSWDEMDGYHAATVNATMHMQNMTREQAIAYLDDPDINRIDALVKTNQNYVLFYMEIDSWLDGTHWILNNLLKFKVERDELKLMLVWTWD